ncbi:MAG: hypothetical protein ABIX01_07095 [Chitinophagaceae bacterium]
MERIGTLIETLQHQHAAGADPHALLVTVQMLQQELLLQNGQSKLKGRNGVSVFMPGQLDIRFSRTEAMQPGKPEPVTEKLVFELDPEIPDEEFIVETPVMPVTATTPSTLHEMPTFTRQTMVNGNGLPAREVNETVIDEKRSINDVLEAVPKVEIAHTLPAEAIKDLRKAVSINDRYQFINYLFKGDETMYERSIKTINSFNILPEATFWIRRELAVKLSWKDDDPLVQEFNRLVGRRFM